MARKQPIASNIAKIYAFNSIVSADVVGGLKQLRSVTDQAIGAAGLGKNLPIIGSGISPSLPFTSRLQNALVDIETAIQAKPTLQTLASTLNERLGPGVTVAASPLGIQISINQSHSLVNQSVGFSVNETFGGIGLQASGNVQVNGNAGLNVVTGMLFGTGSTSDRFYIDAAASTASLALRITSSAIGASIQYGLGTLPLGSVSARLSDGSNNATLGFSLVDPASVSNDGRITLRELTVGLGGIAGTPTSVGDAAVTVTLPTINGTTPQVNLNWSSLTNLVPTTSSSGLDAYLAQATTFDTASVSSGLDSIQTLLSSWLTQAAMTAKIPGLNRSLAELIPQVSVIQDVFTNIKTNGGNTFASLNNAVLGAVSALGISPAELSIVAAAGNSPASQNLRYTVTYNRSVTPGGSLDLSQLMPFLNLSSGVGNLGVTANVKFDFGLGQNGGFYIAPSPGETAPKFNVLAALNVDFPKLDAKVGFIDVGVIGGFQAGPAINIQIKDPNNDSKITTSELGNVTSLIDASVSGDALLAIDFGGRIGDSGPGISSGFKAKWDFVTGAITFGDSRSPRVEDGFKAPQVSAGEFIDKTVHGFLGKVRDYNPIPEDVRDFLTTEIPVIDQTPLDILGGVAGLPPEALALFTITDVLRDLPISNEGVDLSTFKNGESAPAVPSTGSGVPASLSGPLQSLKKYGLAFPFLNNPSDSVLKLLTKQSIDFVTWDSPKFNPSVPLEFKVPPIQAGPVTILITLGGKFGIEGQLSMGLDSSGLFPETGNRNLLSGFYFDNQKTYIAATAGVFIEVTGTLGGIVGVYGKAGVDGKVTVKLADLKKNPADPNNPDARLPAKCGEGDPPDHKTSLEELVFLENHFGLENTVTISGQVDLTGELGVQFLFFKFPIVDVSIPVARFGNSCSPRSTVNGTVVSVIADTIIIQGGTDDNTEIDAKVVRNNLNEPFAIDFFRTVDNVTTRDRRTLASLGNAHKLRIDTGDGADVVTLDQDLTTVLDIREIGVSTKGQKDYVNIRQRNAASHLLFTSDRWWRW